ncbi:MAG TPA: RHS repeat-associated core domain-containing protein, partial [Pyrinomonadaceae bacterium]|nr:RHS repeat-associated core domain-containing protein [Pyrinomonadaceae bacterium]
WQLYGFEGELLAEYAANGAAGSPQKEYGYRNGQLLVTAEPASLPMIPNAGFELPVVGSGSFQYSPSGGSWIFAGGTGVSGNSSAFTSGNPSAPQGVQVAFIQGGNTSLISQSVSGWQSGINYSVSFQAAQRGNCCGAGGQDFDVYLDTTLLGTFKPTGTAYLLLATPTFTTTAGTHTLKFVGRNSLGGDNTAFIDDLRITTAQNVSWTSVAPTIQVTGNSLQKVSGTSSWYDAGAVSSQTIQSGDGYVEFTPGNTATWRMIGLGNGNSSDHYADIEFAFHVAGGGGGLHIYEAGVYRGQFGTYTSNDRLRVAVESGVVKYRKNGALVYTSTVTPTYPLLVDTSLNTVNSQLLNVVISAGGGSGSDHIKWLVADHLGTPRMVFDKTGSLANTRRHDYLAFGEEWFAGMGGRTTGEGYVADGVRQKFTLKERDVETGLDYFLARYYSSTQGRFASPDEFKGGPRELWVLGSGHPEKQALVYAEVTNPQSLNKYQYCFNNPLRYIDPDGQSPQDGYDIQFQKTIKDFNEGRIDEKEYWARMRGGAVGVAGGFAIIVAARGGAAGLTALATWATRNPDKVQQIAQGLQEAAGGPPGLTLGPSSRLTAAEISTGGRLAKQLGVSLTESAHRGEEFVVTGTKTTIDAMGGAQAYQHFGNGSKFFESIVHHVNKSADYTAIDLQGASKSQVKAVQKFVSGLSEEQRRKIIYVQ